MVYDEDTSIARQKSHHVQCSTTDIRQAGHIAFDSAVLAMGGPGLGRHIWDVKLPNLTILAKVWSLFAKYLSFES